MGAVILVTGVLYMFIPQDQARARGEVLETNQPFGSGGRITQSISGGVNAGLIDQIHAKIQVRPHYYKDT